MLLCPGKKQAKYILKLGISQSLNSKHGITTYSSNFRKIFTYKDFWFLQNFKGNSFQQTQLLQKYIFQGCQSFMTFP